MMKQYKWLRTVLFTVGGVLFGLGYYHLAGCGGNCAITASPWTAMIYMGLLGWLLSVFFGKGCGKGCST